MCIQSRWETFSPKPIRIRSLFLPYPGQVINTIMDPKCLNVLLYLSIFGCGIKLAPKIVNENGIGPECPICFLNFAALNSVLCCKQRICTNCYLDINSETKSVSCPFCSQINFAVSFDPSVSSNFLPSPEKIFSSSTESKVDLSIPVVLTASASDRCALEKEMTDLRKFGVVRNVAGKKMISAPKSDFKKKGNLEDMVLLQVYCYDIVSSIIERICRQFVCLCWMLLNNLQATNIHLRMKISVVFLCNEKLCCHLFCFLLGFERNCGSSFN